MAKSEPIIPDDFHFMKPAISLAIKSDASIMDIDPARITAIFATLFIELLCGPANYSPRIMNILRLKLGGNKIILCLDTTYFTFKAVNSSTAEKNNMLIVICRKRIREFAVHLIEKRILQIYWKNNGKRSAIKDKERHGSKTSHIILLNQYLTISTERFNGFHANRMYLYDKQVCISESGS